MNPTDKVDDLLAEAGAQWRASQPSAPEPDLDRIMSTKPKRRWLVPTLAAASVAAIATAALTILPDHNEPTVAPPASQATPQIAQGTAATGKPTADDLLVRNGDKVEVNGQIVIAPGKDAMYCQVMATTLPVIAPGAERAPSCDEDGVRLIGFDAARLTGAKIIKGVSVGDAHVVGVWKDRTITVEEQTAYRTPPASNLDAIACPAPAGGWQSKPSNFSAKAVQDFLDAKQNVISGTRLKYPEGRSRKAPVVFAIGVAHGDLDAFRKTFETIYRGNLCIYRGKVSLTDNYRITDSVNNLLAGRDDLGITAGGGQGPDDGTVPMTLLVLDEKARDAFAPLGLANFEFTVDVRPVR
ncbi:hypothetical protein OHA70_01885 [Kribbella sp. NBC_00382]|uniref:hypothetical protein n=1 Tax=Kribbella sp. NBC_00382 TaxID=2975967 RepID=UPI002E1BD2ED